MTPHRLGPHRIALQRGFTLVEMLLVVAIIILLLSIILVALNQANRRAQQTNTQFLMSSINQAMATFEKDIGYLPPILGDPTPAAPDDLRSLYFPPDPGAASYFNQVQNWYSITTLAEYLIGYGPDKADAHDGLGIRHPGSDGAWGAAIGSGAYADRNLGVVASSGRIYGPYLDLDDNIIAAVDQNGSVFFPGDGGFSNALPKTIVDYWGSPIRYYRRAYPPGALNQSYRSVQGARVPTLADVVALRPFRIPTGLGIDLGPGFADVNGDVTATTTLRSSPFALFSAGPDRALTPDARFDDGTEFNQDNIVEASQ